MVFFRVERRERQIEVIKCIADVATGVSAVIALVVFVVSMFKRRNNKIYKKREHTFNVISTLQNEVFAELNCYKKEEISDIAQNSRNEKENFKSGRTYKQEYGYIVSMIAKLDHFAYGVENDFYDFNIVNELCGNYLTDIFHKVMPIIEKSRRFNHKDISFRFIEELVKRINNEGKNK